MTRQQRRTGTIEGQVVAMIIVAMMPPIEVSPNYHGSWRKRARAVREFREQAGWAAKIALGSNEGRSEAFIGARGQITLDAEIRWCCGRKTMDDDNAKASLKGCLDGVADALFGGEDKHVIIGEVTQSRGNGTVTLWLRHAALKGEER